MVGMDIFQQDPFSMVSMTEAVEKTPFVPQMLGSLGIFEPEPVTTLTVAIEKRDNVLALIQTSNRGAPLAYRDDEKRNIRDFRTVRIAKGEVIYAHELQSIRAFGSETEMQSVQARVARANMRLRADMELTHENMRLGAIQGIVTDADNSVINNWYTEWGISQAAAIDFALGTATTKVRGKCMQVIRGMKQQAKGSWTPATQVHGLCGDGFFDALVDHALVRDTYQNWSAATDLRQDLAYQSFPYGGIVFHNYRGTDDFVDPNSDGTAGVGIGDNDAKFFPVNAPGVFKVAYSPAETFDFVNTPGREVYGMVIPDTERNSKVDVEQYSYPLYICTRPEMLQRATA